MSSVIGILNKQAVALAADSAVTISSRENRKIFNSANKIFTLSKYHPVGVMIYNSASFMGTPWEIIIKMYRKQLKGRSFKTVEAYQKDFLKYLRANNFFSDRDEENSSLADFFLFWLYTLKEDIKKHYPELFVNPTTKNKAKFLEILSNNVDALIDNLKRKEPCEDFKNYNLRSFSAYTKDVFDKCIEWIFKNDGFKIPDNMKSKIRRYLYLKVITKDFIQNYSGLIFVGYGENEIYPQLIPVHISFVLDDKLRFFVDKNMQANINSKNNAVISPFAQIDVINTILSGIDPKLDYYYMENFKKFLNKYNQLLANQVKNESEELAEVIRGLPTEGVLKEFIEENTKKFDKMNISFRL